MTYHHKIALDTRTLKWESINRVGRGLLWYIFIWIIVSLLIIKCNYVSDKFITLNQHQSQNFAYEMPTTCYNLRYSYDIMSQHLNQICIYSPHITYKNSHYLFHTLLKFQIILRAWLSKPIQISYEEQNNIPNHSLSMSSPLQILNKYILK